MRKFGISIYFATAVHISLLPITPEITKRDCYEFSYDPKYTQFAIITLDIPKTRMCDEPHHTLHTQQ